MKAKSRLLLIALAAILATVLTQPTLAYYTNTGKTTNVVTSGGIELRIHEKTADGGAFPEEIVPVLPGDTVSKQVTIENVCRHPFYLRVKLIYASANGERPAGDFLNMDIDTENWTYLDGFYYYNRILQPGETTPALFTQVEIDGDRVDQSDMGSAWSLTVSASAVQSENNPADHPWDASGWPGE